MLLDCHTHKKPPYPQGIVNASVGDALLPSQLYSVGIHPWYIPSDPTQELEELLRQAKCEEVVAIGETGLDTLCHTPMWLQIKIFERHIELSEELNKPLIIHCVRTASEIAQMRKRVNARMPWIIHGFRGKPSLLEILLQAGCYISYSQRFNTESLLLTPTERILAETDDSELNISQIIENISIAKDKEMTHVIAENTHRIFLPNIPKI